jgi:GNAT superfamily N-acetyltransferase
VKAALAGATSIRSAHSGEAGALSALALRSKAHWGYDATFIEACRAELTVGPERFGRDVVIVLERDDVVRGFYVLAGAGDAGELDFFYIDPTCIGRGFGALLWRHAVTVARRRGHHRVIIHSDPHAEGFYRAMGARRVGEVPSGSIAGRSLPLMRFEIERHGKHP